MSENMILEIGTEEIPSGFISSALIELNNLAEKKLQDCRLSFDKINTFATPRRMILEVINLSPLQSDMVKEIKGPPTRVAYAPDGNPTPAAMGFAKSQNVEVKDLFIKSMAQGEYVFAKCMEKGKGAVEILSELLPSIIKSLSFPKNMYWDESGIKFPRPVRWILALFGSEVIPFKFGNLASGRLTKGHRFLSSGSLEVSHCNDFKNILHKNKVAFDHEERKKTIKSQIEALATGLKCNVKEIENLLEEVNFLVEYPTAFTGQFSFDYLSLPVELLVTVMTKHQRYFSLIDKEGNIMPYFIAVRNGDDRGLDLVKSGNEKVLSARLADAKYFFEEDKKGKLDRYISKLKDIGFQKNLGTMLDKSGRIVKLAETVALATGKNELVDDTKRAGELCKADLASHMVSEFSSLQGIMGGIYAGLSGENTSVSLAIREHYKPAFSLDDIPSTPAGQIISFADKLDSISGCFGAGYIPSGSQDPYGVRRYTLGIIKILLSGELNVNLIELFSKGLSLYEEQGFSVKTGEDTVKEFEEFAFQRFENYLLSTGLKYDVIKSVKSGALKNLKETVAKVNAITDVRDTQEFQALVTSFTRASNIIKKTSEALFTFNKENLIDEHEKTLYEEYKKVSERVDELFSYEKIDYADIMKELSSLRPWIDKFFDNVMVMVPQEDIKNNRLALLRMVVSLYLNIADFSEIVIEGSSGN